MKVVDRGALRDRITRWAKEYQFALSVWRDRFVKAGGTTELEEIRKPTIEELPQAIEPVPTVKDITEPIAEALTTITAPLRELGKEAAKIPLYVGGALAALLAITLLGRK